MSTPPIQYSGPHIADDVPWAIRQHIQLIYQKLGNHTQAFSLQQAAISKLKGGSTTTIVQGGGGSSVPISLGAVNDQSGNVAYTTTPGDAGVLLVLNDASPVAVTLDSSANPDFYLTSTNFGAGLVTFTPNGGALINGAATFTLTTDGFTIILWNGTAWYATEAFTTPQSTPAVAGEFITAYNSTTGAFSQATPTGFSGTIATAKLTVGGSNGSMVFSNGLLTASTPAT